MYARVSVRKTVSLSEVAMSHEGPARPAALTPQLLSDVHQVTNVLQNPGNPSVSATSSGSTATVSSSATSVQNSEPAHVVLSSSTTTVPSTSTTSVTSSPIPSLSENSQSNFEAVTKGFQEQLDAMKMKADGALVETALATLQLLVSKPPALFDPYAALAALEHLVDSAREVRHEGAKRYAVILRQCRPLVHNSAMQSVLVKLVADKEEAEVAKVIDKTIRRQPGVGNRDARALGRTRWFRPENVARGRGNSGRQPLKCYSCGQPGHFARNCNKKM